MKDGSGRRATWVAAIAGLCAAFAIGGCTSVSPQALKERESSGVTRRYDRPATDLYSASVAAIDHVRTDSNYWNQLKIVERDPAKGTVIAQQSLDSAVIPGVGTSDGIGIFVKDVPPGDSDVTVVVMSSDQVPGSAGTSMSSYPTAASLVFPAIDQALESIPETPRAAAAPAPARPVAAPAARAISPAPAAVPASTAPSTTAPAAAAPLRSVAAPAAATGLDRVYDTLRASGSWRPLVRETRADGSEEIRIGSWATITDTGDGRVHLKMRENAPPADAARLALELSQAGFSVVVESEPSTTRHGR